MQAVAGSNLIVAKCRSSCLACYAVGMLMSALSQSLKSSIVFALRSVPGTTQSAGGTLPATEGAKASELTKSDGAT